MSSQFKNLNFGSASQPVHANGEVALAAASFQTVPRIFDEGMPETDSSVEILTRRCKTGRLGSAQVNN